MKYRAEIDGLRTVAVVPVILFHMDFKWIEGGYLGVDVFFVISGFLITTIILADINSNRFTFRGFWAKRIRRIVPALMVMLATTLIVLSQFAFLGHTKTSASQGVAALLSFSNIAFWRSGGNYWGDTTQDSPFLHTWSLSVEEQYYFIYPFFVVLVLRYARRWLTASLLLVTVFSFFLYIFGNFYKPEATFFLLPARAWELGCGCLLAVWSRRGPDDVERTSGRFADSLALCGLAAVVSSYVIFSARYSFPGYLAIPVIGASLFIGFANSNSGVGRLLSLRPIVFVGAMSYSLYLWHWPVIVLVPSCFYMAKWAAAPLSLLVIISVLAFLSYRFVETPTRRAVLGPKLLLFCAGMLVINLGLCRQLYYQSQNYDLSHFAPVIFEGNSYASSPPSRFQGGTDEDHKGIQWTPNAPDTATAWANDGIIKKYDGDLPEIVTLGDSHALMWAGTIDQIAKRIDKTVSYYAAFGITPFFKIPPQREKRAGRFGDIEQKYIYDVNRLERLTAWKPKVVVIAARWDWYFDAPPPIDLIEFLGKNGATVILIQQPPLLSIGDNTAVQYLSYLGVIPRIGEKQYIRSKTNETKYRWGQQYVRELCSTYPFCRAVEVEDSFRSPTTGEVCVLDGSDVVYLDEDHLSAFGAVKLLPAIEKAIEDAFTSSENKQSRNVRER